MVDPPVNRTKVKGVIGSAEINLGTGGLNLGLIREGRHRAKHYLITDQTDIVLGESDPSKVHDTLNFDQLLIWLAQWSQALYEYTCELELDTKGKVVYAKFWRGT